MKPNKTPAQLIIEREEKRQRGRRKPKAGDRPSPLPKEEGSPLVSDLLLQIKGAGLMEPELEVRFHSTRKWRLDIAWPERFVAVEVHGGTWSNGRHTRGDGFQKDRAKMNEAMLRGWKVLEVTGDQIKEGQALKWIEQALSPVAGV